MRNACSPEEALFLIAEDMERKREEERERIRNKNIHRPNAIREQKEKSMKERSELLEVAKYGIETGTLIGPTLKTQV
jgi:hypothetical protein